jgi:hypothetical protein
VHLDPVYHTTAAKMAIKASARQAGLMLALWWKTLSGS